MKRELNEALSRIKENSAVVLTPELAERVGEIASSAFVPLFEELANRTRKTVLAVQVGTLGYRVERTTNLLDVRVGTLISREEAETLIKDGIAFTVYRNK